MLLNCKKTKKSANKMALYMHLYGKTKIFVAPHAVYHYNIKNLSLLND